MTKMTAADFGAYYSDAKVAQLAKAFAKVTPAGNWKEAIDADIVATVDEIQTVKEAVTFYTGSIASVFVVDTLSPNAGMQTLLHVRVRAAGYYAAIGA
jgi:hypothetical protein